MGRPRTKTAARKATRKATLGGTKARERRGSGVTLSKLIGISAKNAEEIESMEEGARYKEGAMNKRCNM